MISTLEKEITLRYLKTRKKDGFLNIISIFSFIGISLGVAVLIIVMSVMNGFRTELINKIIGFNAHVTVKPYENSIDIKKLDEESLKMISKELIFSNSGEAIIISKDYTKGLILRGYSSKDFSKLDFFKNVSLKEQSNQLIPPQIFKVTKLKDFLKDLDDSTKLLFADVNSKDNLKEEALKGAETLSLLIGPEGDFSPSERELIHVSSNVVPFKISKNILRSDTAVISAISLVNFINNFH